MYLCEKCEFDGDFCRLFRNDPWGEKSEYESIHKVHFCFEKCEKPTVDWRGGEGGVQDLERQFWTSFNLSAMFLESHERDGEKKASAKVKMFI